MRKALRRLSAFGRASQPKQSNQYDVRDDAGGITKGARAIFLHGRLGTHQRLRPSQESETRYDTTT
jgi:hypothetical protein